MTPQELKNSILQQAIQGKLVEQRRSEGTAEELYQQIQAEKKRLIAEKKIKKEKGNFCEIGKDDIPYDIPNNWLWVRFGSIMINRDSERIPLSVSERASLDKVYDYYGASGIIDKVDKYLFDKTLLLIGEDGANLLTRSTPIAYLATGKYWVNNHAHVLDCNESYIDIKYIMYFINAINLAKYVTGTAQPKMNQEKMNSIPIALPPLAEQKRIVSRIEELLPLIDRYKAAWSRLEDFNKRFPDDMQKSILQQAIQGKLVEQRPEEGTAEELYQQIQKEKQRLIAEKKIKKEKPLPEITEEEKPFEIPETWKWAYIGSVCTNIQYGTSAKSTPTGKIPVLRMGNIQNGKIDYSKLVYTSDEYEIEKYHIDTNDLLFNRTNSKELVGKTAIYKGEMPAIYAGYLVRLTPVIMDSDFLNYVMQSKYYWGYCQTVRSDAIGQSNINAEKLKQFIFPLPPLAEQKRIVAKIEQLLPLCEKLK